MNIENLRKTICSLLSRTSVNKVSSLLKEILLDETISNKVDFSKDSMFKVIVLGKLKGIKFATKLTEYLKSHLDEALELGFYKDEDNIVRLPDRRTLGRFQNKINNEDKHFIASITKTIEDTAYLAHKPLDFDYIGNDKEAAEKPIRKRQLYNISEEKASKLGETFKRILLKKLKKEQRYNSIFSKNDFLNLILNAALYGTYTESGYRLSKFNSDQKVPKPETLFHYLKKYDIDMVTKAMQDTLDVTLAMAFGKGLLSKRKDYTVCIDEHKIPFYGKNKDYAARKNFERGTTFCFEFITVEVREHEGRFTLAVLPVLSKSDKVAQVKQLLETSISKLRVRMVLLDRGFLDSNIINMIKRLDLKFIIPSKKSNKGTLMAKHLKPPAFIKYVPIGKARAHMAIVKDNKSDELHGFFTNIDMNIGDSNAATYIANLYRGRWQIETGYRTKGDFRARTTSPKYLIRNFYFMTSVILYNIWVIVNEAIMMDLKLNFDRPKTVVSAKIFIRILIAIKAG